MGLIVVMTTGFAITYIKKKLLHFWMELYHKFVNIYLQIITQVHCGDLHFINETGILVNKAENINYPS